MFKPLARITLSKVDWLVSIPRSGFWVFKPVIVLPGSSNCVSFNPSVGILGVQATPAESTPDTPSSFNPSVGILGVQA